MPITALYAALLACLFIALSFRVIGQRISKRVALGDAGDAALRRRIRVHGNFAEYAPLALILLGLAESLSGPRMLLHGIGVALLAGRALHAYGVSQEPDILPLRQAGMVLTITSIAAGAIACLWLSLTQPG